MPKEKEKPQTVPTFQTLLLAVNLDERVQMESISRAISGKMMLGRLVTNWCAKCGKWRLQFVSNERMKDVLSNETFLCTKCGVPIRLLIDREHTLLSS